MAANAYLALDSNGLPTEVRGVQTSAGSGDVGKYPALNASGVLDTSFMPAGIGADSLSVLASENIAAGDMVNVYNNSGTLNVRKADNTAASRGKLCNGFALSSITSGQSGTITFSGIATGLSSLTPGTILFLGATGAVTATPTTTPGNTLQEVGFALSATTMKFKLGTPYLRA